MFILMWSVIILGIFLGGIVIFLTVRSYFIKHRVMKEVDAFIMRIKSPAVNTFSYTMLEGLPEPVQRYFRYALKDGQEYIRFAKIKSVAQFKRPATPHWTTLLAEDYVAAAPPEYMHNSVMKQNALLWFDVRNYYIHGKASMQVYLFSGLKVFSQSTSRELNINSLLLWTGKAVLFPTALLPSEYIQWEPIDDHSAKTIITDGDNRGEYRFYFNDVGEIIRTESDERYELIDGKFQKVRSITYKSDYKEIAGIKIPMKALVVTILPDGTREEQWKGEFVDIQFNNFTRYEN